jgi:hypothetical protein
MTPRFQGGRKCHHALIGHTCELRHANISIPKLREENQQYAQNLEHAAFVVSI